jgi:hypothetical protein
VSRVVRIHPSLIVEPVGAEYLILTASGTEVVRATGDAAEVITCAINGQPVPDRLHPAAHVLQHHGVLAANTFTTSRRQVLHLGVAAAAVGLTVLALPNAAAAASAPTWYETNATSVRTGCVGDEGQSFDIVFPDPGTFTFTVTSGPQNTVVNLIGGGGSGSNRLEGGGGGGSGRTFNPVTLTTGTYTITVGAGGVAPDSGLDGNDGGMSRVLRDGVLDISNAGGRGGGGGIGGTSSNPFRGGGSPGDGNGGGGGGVQGFGQNGSGVTGGNGGTGAFFPYFGYPAGAVGGGGGGAGVSFGGVGTAGGGNGWNPGNAGQDGAANTGGGGGGGYNGTGAGAGGSGVVIIRLTDSACPTTV